MYGKAINQVDVVISTIGYGQLEDQRKIIAAIKEAGIGKHLQPRPRFFELLRLKESLILMLLPTSLLVISSQHWSSSPRDKVVIFGDGNPKAVFCKEDDTCMYTN